MPKTSKAYSVMMLIILMLGTAILYYSNMVFAVRPMEMVEQYGVTQADIAAISTIGGIPGAVLSIIVGNILDRKSIKLFVGITMIGAVICMAIRIFMTDYVGLMVTTVAIGALLLPMIIVGPKMLGNLFAPRDIPIALGFFGAAGGVGTTLSFAMGDVFIGVQEALISVCVVGIIVTVLWLIVCKSDKYMDNGQAPVIPKGAFIQVLRSSNMWKTMICGGFAVGASLLINSNLIAAYFSLNPDILANGAVDPTVLGTITNVCLIAGGIISGLVIGKAGKFNVPYLVFCVGGGALFLAGWLVGEVNGIGAGTIILYALAGIVFSGSVGTNFTRIPLLPLTKQFGIEMTGAASGMLQTALGVFQFVIPTAVTAAFVTAAGTDYTGIFIWAFIFVAAAGIIGMFIPELGVKGKLAQEAGEGINAGPLK